MIARMRPSLMAMSAPQDPVLVVEGEHVHVAEQLGRHPRSLAGRAHRRWSLF